MKRLGIVVIFALISLSVLYALHTFRLDTLRFSNTQTWDEGYLAKMQQPSAFALSHLSTITLPPPPSNNSTRTRAELHYLKLRTAERTPEKVREIEQELLFPAIQFGELTLDELTVQSGRIYTAQLIQKSTDLSFPFIMYFKNSFDRVRPSFLDSQLTTAITVPEHPAYPSGHATQAYLAYLLLRELDTENAETYLQAATRVARNRELAGVHYPSDSEAGVLLATRLYPLLFEDAEFAFLFAQAQGEW
jgi:hypothetical protein